MSPPHTHDRNELAALEASTGMYLLGYLLAGTPGALVPILCGRRLPEHTRRALVHKLNGLGLPVVEGSPVECVRQDKKAG